jgi:hypothetical protein
MWLFSIVSYVALYLLLAFGALCLATGLYYLSELCEEYSKWTRLSINYAIRTICALYGLLWLIDDLPFMYALFGALSHLLYASMLVGFPFFHFGQSKFLACCAMFIVSQVVWWRYFSSPYVDEYSFAQIFAFYFAMVWLVPFAFFISLSPYDKGIPVDGFGQRPVGSAADGSATGPDPFGGKKRSSLLAVLKAKTMSLVASVKMQASGR